MSAENLAPQVMASLARQIKQLLTKPPDGVKYVPTDGTLTEVLADIAGPGQWFPFSPHVVSRCFDACSAPRRVFSAGFLRFEEENIGEGVTVL